MNDITDTSHRRILVRINHLSGINLDLAVYIYLTILFSKTAHASEIVVLISWLFGNVSSLSTWHLTTSLRNSNVHVYGEEWMDFSAVGYLRAWGMRPYVNDR